MVFFMGMVLFQVRLPEKVVSSIEDAVKKGFYESKSDLVRDAIRRFVFEEQIASVSLKKNYSNEIKSFRKKQVIKKFDLEKINSL